MILSEPIISYTFNVVNLKTLVSIISEQLNVFIYLVNHSYLKRVMDRIRLKTYRIKSH